jgi:hypothetical protein
MLPCARLGFAALAFARQVAAREDHVDQLALGGRLLRAHVEPNQSGQHRRRHCDRGQRDAQSQLHVASSTQR